MKKPDRVKMIIDDLNISLEKKTEYWNTVIMSRKKGVEVTVNNGLLIFDESNKFLNQNIKKLKSK